MQTHSQNLGQTCVLQNAWWLATSWQMQNQIYTTYYEHIQFITKRCTFQHLHNCGAILLLLLLLGYIY